MDRLHAMKVFTKVAQTKGFAGAARALNMSAPAVTRAIAALEAEIGTLLFTRTTRTVRLTDVGARYLVDVQRILADIAEAEAAAAGSYSRPTGTLTVTASVLFGQLYVMPVLLEFLAQNPGVDGRAVFLDRVTNLVDEGMDVAVRIGHLPDSSLSAIKVGQVRTVVCASPDYFARQGRPQSPRDLTGHRIVASTALLNAVEWRFGRNADQSVQIRPRLACNSNRAAINAAVDGWGITRVLSYQVGQELLDGRLEVVLEEHEQPPLPIHIVHPDGRRAPAKVRAFVDMAVDRLRGNQVFH